MRKIHHLQPMRTIVCWAGIWSFFPVPTFIFSPKTWYFIFVEQLLWGILGIMATVLLNVLQDFHQHKRTEELQVTVSWGAVVTMTKPALNDWSPSCSQLKEKETPLSIFKRIKTDYYYDFSFLNRRFSLILKRNTDIWFPHKRTCLPVVHAGVQKMALLIGNQQFVVFVRCFK